MNRAEILMNITKEQTMIKTSIIVACVIQNLSGRFQLLHLDLRIMANLLVKKNAKDVGSPTIRRTKYKRSKNENNVGTCT
jgi:hypothetical protein